MRRLRLLVLTLRHTLPLRAQYRLARTSMLANFEAASCRLPATCAICACTGKDTTVVLQQLCLTPAMTMPGSTTLPRDLDILKPLSSSTKPADQSHFGR